MIWYCSERGAHLDGAFFGGKFVFLYNVYQDIGTSINLGHWGSDRDPGCPILHVPNHRLRDYLPDSVHHNFQIFIDP